MYGLPPGQLYPAILARRKAKLGPLYDSFYPALPPKKPVTSVQLPGAFTKAERRTG